MSDNDSDIAMVAAIISLAHALNMKVVAEGVEKQEEIEILKRYECEYVQGYYFSPPIEANLFENKVKEQVAFLI